MSFKKKSLVLLLSTYTIIPQLVSDCMPAMIVKAKLFFF